jgi:hypothetical protein
MHNKTLLFGITLLQHSRHFDYRNQPLTMCIRVCYLDCHESKTVLLPSDTHLKTYYVHYSCFTSIRDLFTDSPS